MKVEFEGHVFDSKREAARWVELRRQAMAGEITDLQRQVPFDLTVFDSQHPERGFQRIGTYVADFTYRHEQTLVVEDSKGMKTDIYKWKKKHFELEYGFKIRET